MSIVPATIWNLPLRIGCYVAVAYAKTTDARIYAAIAKNMWQSANFPRSLGADDVVDYHATRFEDFWRGTIDLLMAAGIIERA